MEDGNASTRKGYDLADTTKLSGLDRQGLKSRNQHWIFSLSKSQFLVIYHFNLLIHSMRGVIFEQIPNFTEWELTCFQLLKEPIQAKKEIFLKT